MHDQWTIITPDGFHTLPGTFAPEQLEAGGVDTSTLTRRDDTSMFARTGDGLRTPAPLKFTGRIWRDDPADDADLMAELASITVAVTTAIGLRRDAPGLTTVMSGFAGGPVPSVQSDGLFGLLVELEFWPGDLLASQPSQFLPGFTWGVTDPAWSEPGVVWATRL